METLLPSQPLSSDHQTGTNLPAPAAQPATQNADHSSPIGSKPHLQYKCLLYQLTQKLKDPPPILQTQNEGSHHLPMFRSSVTLDGVTYTSSSTFQQLRMAENDASKVAYVAITQKIKTEALNFIREEKIYCKSVLVEYAAGKNIEKPVYETTQVESLRPVFRANMLFNGITCSAVGTTKKEAEQLVARSFITRFLESETGIDMALRVNNKLKQYKENNSVQRGLNVLGAQAGVGHGEPTTPAAPVVIQPPTLPLLTVSVVTEPPTSQQPAEPIKPAVAEPLDLAPIPSAAAVVNNSCTQVLPAPLVAIPEIDHSSVIKQEQKEEPSTLQLPVEPVKPAVAVPAIEPSSDLKQETNEEPSTLQLPVEPAVAVPAIDPTSVLKQEPKAEPLTSQELEYIPLVAETSSKKRNRKNEKDERKKMRADDAQMPVVPTSQALPCPSQ